MKGRGLDHLEGHETNQILASNGTQGQETSIRPACEPLSVIRLTPRPLTYLGSSIPQTLGCRKIGLTHESVVSSTHIFRPLHLPSSCAGWVVRIHCPVLAHFPRFSTGLTGKAGVSVHMPVTCIVERGSVLPGRTERGTLPTSFSYSSWLKRLSAHSRLSPPPHSQPNQIQWGTQSTLPRKASVTTTPCCFPTSITANMPLSRREALKILFSPSPFFSNNA